MTEEPGLKEKLARLHALTLFSPLERTWTFTAKTSEGPALHVVHFGSADDHLSLLQCREGFDPALAAALLRHVGDVPDDFFDEEPVRTLRDFSFPGRGFDRIVAVGPLAHHQFEAASPELQECTVALFPAYACEFKGDEEASRVRTLRKYFVATLDWTRAPQPRLLMMHRNTVTQSRSPGQKRGLARLEKCFRELETLPEGADSFVEIENIAGEVLRIVRGGEHYDIEWLEPPRPLQHLKFQDMLAFVRRFLGAP
jgi:hypothetical protein